jgi:hypothetical protein
LIDAWKDYCENRIRSHRRDVLKHLAGRIQTLEAELSNLRSNSNFEANSGQLLIAQQNLDTAMELREDIAHSSQMHPLDSLKFTIIKPPFAFSTRSLSDQPDWQTWDYGGAHEEIFRHFFHRGVLD